MTSIHIIHNRHLGCLSTAALLAIVHDVHNSYVRLAKYCLSFPVTAVAAAVCLLHQEIYWRLTFETTSATW